MTLEAQLDRLSARIARCEARDPELAAALAADLLVLRSCAAVPAVARALEILSTARDALDESEASHRQSVTPQQVVEAVRIHGSIRGAARSLGISHQTAMRRLAELVHGPPDPLLPVEPASIVDAFVHGKVGAAR